METTADSSPLKTLKTMMSAAVPTATPTIEIPEIILIILCDFFEIKYLRAIKNEKFKAHDLVHKDTLLYHFHSNILLTIICFWFSGYESSTSKKEFISN